MGLFSVFKTRDSRLDSKISEIENDMSNNYKDAAQTAFKELKEAFDKMNNEGRLNTKQKTYYSGKIQEFSQKLQGYSHKDQKPYWTHQ